MNEFKSLCKKLPDMQQELFFEATGEVTRITFSGTFKCKIMNNKERILVEKMSSSLNGNIEVPLTVSNYNYMLSYLNYSLLETPRWWQDSDFGAELYDANVVEELYKQVLEFENSWTKSVWGDLEDEESEESR